MINHMCLNCGQDLQIPDEYAGQQGTCPKCGATFRVPMPFSPQGPPPEEGGQGEAIASLICGALSFACLSLLAAVPAVVLGHMSLSKIRRGLMPAGARGLAIAGLVLGYVNILSTVALAVLLVVFASARAGLGPVRGGSEVSDCQNNLKQMGVVFKMWAGENRGKWPHVSATPGQLMATHSEIYPEYLSDLSVLVCPADSDAANMPVQADDVSYFYLGYVVTNDREVASYCKAYRERMAQGQSFDGDLSVPMGEGTGGGNTLRRLAEGVERFLITDINNPAASMMVQSMIPVLIERPDNHRRRAGGNVLYMDGHVEFIPYPGKWPMTEETVNALKQLGDGGV